MRNVIILFSAILVVFSSHASATYSHFINFQNFHGSCPSCKRNPCNCNGPCPPCTAPSCAPTPPPCAPCDPCAPCAPICGTECGVSICAIGIAVLALAGAAAIILSSGETEHAH